MTRTPATPVMTPERTEAPAPERTAVITCPECGYVALATIPPDYELAARYEEAVEALRTADNLLSTFRDHIEIGDAELLAHTGAEIDAYLLRRHEESRTTGAREAPYRVGDWIRFRRHDGFRIGLVEYVDRSPHWPNEWRAHTSEGIVKFDNVLERRAAREGAREE